MIRAVALPARCGYNHRPPRGRLLPAFTLVQRRAYPYWELVSGTNISVSPPTAAPRTPTRSMAPPGGTRTTRSDRREGNDAGSNDLVPVAAGSPSERLPTLSNASRCRESSVVTPPHVRRKPRAPAPISLGAAESARVRRCAAARVELRRKDSLTAVQRPVGVERAGDVLLLKSGDAAVFCGAESDWDTSPLPLAIQTHGVPRGIGRPPRPYPDAATVRGDAESEAGGHSMCCARERLGAQRLSHARLG